MEGGIAGLGMQLATLLDPYIRIHRLRDRVSPLRLPSMSLDFGRLDNMTITTSGAEWDADGDASPERLDFHIRRLRGQRLARLFDTPAPIEGIYVLLMLPPSCARVSEFCSVR